MLLRSDGREAHRWPSNLDSALSLWGAVAAARDEFQYSLAALACGLSKTVELARITDWAVRLDRRDVDDDQSQSESFTERGGREQGLASTS